MDDAASDAAAGEVVFVTELPHTDSGKIRKKSLSREPLAR